MVQAQGPQPTQCEQYVAYFQNDSNGLLENTSSSKVSKFGFTLIPARVQSFIVPTGAQVHFRVRMGSPLAENPVLLVNLPEPTITCVDVDGKIRAESPLDLSHGGSGETQTQKGVAQTLIHSARTQSTAATYTMTQPRNQDGTMNQMGDGWPLSTTYLKRISPNNFMSGSQMTARTYFEFSVDFQTSGSFFVQVEYGKRDLVSHLSYSQPSYINVEPVLSFSATQQVRCKELSICTVLSRCLGHIDRWKEVLTPLSDQGYNAVHFTPIQQYGESFSHYSLADQTAISDYFFACQSDEASTESEKEFQPLSKKAKFEKVEQVISAIRSDLKLFGIVDIVLNHTANNSEWIQNHPEACYNLEDVPRLYPAYLLDATLQEVSHEFSQGRVAWCPSAPYLNSAIDLNLVVAEMSRRVQSLRLHEFFLCDFNRSSFMGTLHSLSGQSTAVQIEEFKKRGFFAKEPIEIVKKHFLENLGHGPHRRQVSLRQPETAIFFFHLSGQNVTQAIEQAQRVVNALNSLWTTTVTSWMAEAMENCRGTMNYFILQRKKNLITSKNQLLDPYFQTLANEAQSKVVHNGWIADHDPRVDFALEQDFPYLRRQVNIWGDSIKLRFGESPASSPYLWAHMGEYVSQMAALFDGFRLDNAHSTPIHVCQYMLQLARSRNTNLMVMAELFTSSAELDALFTTRLNINGMIREIMNRGDTRGVGAYFHEITCREAVVGKLDADFEKVQEAGEGGQATFFKVLMPTKPNDIIYDCTHDNPSPLEKFGTRRLALPTMGLLSLADQIIASTWGYDQLLPVNLSVCAESRLYPVEATPRSLWSLSQSTAPARPPLEYVFRYSSNCHKVSVAGEFNQWQPSLQMQREPNSNNWQVALLVGEHLQGRRIQFKFVEDGSRWHTSHSLPKMSDGHGNENNFFELGELRRGFDPQHQVKKMADLRVVRMLLNEAHRECTSNSAEIYMHSQTDDTIVVVRQLSLAHRDEYDAYVTIQRFPFRGCNEGAIQTSVELPGLLADVVFAANMVDDYQLPKTKSHQDSSTFVSAPGSEVFIHNSLQAFARVIDGAKTTRLEFFNMPQTFTCLLKTKVQVHVKQAVRILDQFWSQSSYQVAKQIATSRLSLCDINHLLFRCENEERDISSQQRGPYGLSDHGMFVYAGLQGPLHLLTKLKLESDMGHSLLNNIREGDWLMEYSEARLASELKDMPRLTTVHSLMSAMFTEVKKLPTAYKPRYVTRVFEKLSNAALCLLTHIQMQPQVAFSRTPDPFLQSLVLACAQMYGRVPSAVFRKFKSSMCAGLPHFSTGYTRCWGRDTFISLRGLFLTTGLFREAKDTILFFASVERHGLLPNLHDQGNNTRFNARDATWFFLQAVKDYILMADDGESILGERVEAQFESQRILTIEQLIMKILQAHATGINFREWNAGVRIDEQMKDNGFNVRIEADLAETGFCFGGNVDNCGTWMDKMGSAYNVNKGVPATPRDGAPIELVALQYSVLSFLASLNAQGKFPHAGVREITFRAWANLIKANFNRCFYVPRDPSSDSTFEIDPRFVNRRGIYKDVFRSAHGYTDYQLRPNLCVAMAVAPDLFERSQAQGCLEIVEQVLIGEGALGIKTLDPTDRQFRGDYDNDDATRGHNYHQGPEWVWPLGFFLKSKLNFCDYSSQREAAQDIVRFLLPHQIHMLRKDPWHSLPELTNAGGKPCRHSCPAQAWSIATILDALHSLGFYKPTSPK